MHERLLREGKDQGFEDRRICDEDGEGKEEEQWRRRVEDAEKPKRLLQLGDAAVTKETDCFFRFECAFKDDLLTPHSVEEGLICDGCGQRRSYGSAVSLPSIATEPGTGFGVDVLPTIVEEARRNGTEVHEEAGGHEQGFWKTEPSTLRRQSLWSIFMRGRRDAMDF